MEAATGRLPRLNRIASAGPLLDCWIAPCAAALAKGGPAPPVSDAWGGPD